MKYILSFLGIGIIAAAIFLCGLPKSENINNDFLRIHIVANSNSVDDQNVKYLVKDAVVEFLLPKLAQASNKQEAQSIVSENMNKISEVVKVVLLNNEKCYESKLEIVQENVPLRAYDNFVLQEGLYDTLRVQLGDGKGDNWWCVVFPAVCFVDSKNPDNFEYISKIWDMINSVTNKF